MSLTVAVVTESVEMRSDAMRREGLHVGGEELVPSRIAFRKRPEGYLIEGDSTRLSVPCNLLIARPKHNRTFQGYDDAGLHKRGSLLPFGRRDVVQGTELIVLAPFPPVRCGAGDPIVRLGFRHSRMVYSGLRGLLRKDQSPESSGEKH